MLKREHLQFSLFLFFLGIIGISSLLLMPFNYSLLPKEAVVELKERFSEFQLRIMATLNPLILLVGSIVIGLFVYRKDSSRSYIQSLFFKDRSYNISLGNTVLSGIIYGIVVSIVITILYYFLRENKNILILESTSPNLPIITKILYGGITEEIIVRWGWLSLVYVVLLKIIKTEKYSKVFAILISSFLFGLGHLGNILFMGDIDLLFVITYIVVLNFLIGIPLGYLFLKKNIEASIIAHATFHIASIGLYNVFF